MKVQEYFIKSEVRNEIVKRTRVEVAPHDNKF